MAHNDEALDSGEPVSAEQSIQATCHCSSCLVKQITIGGFIRGLQPLHACNPCVELKDMMTFALYAAQHCRICRYVGHLN